MTLEHKSFGNSINGEDIALYTISNSKGMKVSVANFGAILVNLLVPDGEGRVEDVVLGYDTLEPYFSNPCYFGATIGPSANRIENARFSIDGATFFLDANDGKNNLHSHHQKGYHKKIWAANAAKDSVSFTLEDEDGNMGFPGKKTFKVTYALDEGNTLTIFYHGFSDQKTLINPTNHTYFNLDGHGSGSMEGHELTLKASHYTPVREGAIPTGEIAPVKGTPMDFTVAKKIGRDIGADFEQLKLTGGYDHNWVLDGCNGELREFAIVSGPKSGRKMRAYTTLPGVQFYAGNSILPIQGKGGVTYGARDGFCLETQFFPNSVNQYGFPSCVFGEGKDYESVTVYEFLN
jgi:aldose 1-epimerase